LSRQRDRRRKLIANVVRGEQVHLAAAVALQQPRGRRRKLLVSELPLDRDRRIDDKGITVGRYNGPPLLLWPCAPGQRW
jgi:hypothetical protein